MLSRRKFLTNLGIGAVSIGSIGSVVCPILASESAKVEGWTAVWVCLPPHKSMRNNRLATHTLQVAQQRGPFPYRYKYVDGVMDYRKRSLFFMEMLQEYPQAVEIQIHSYIAKEKWKSDWNSVRYVKQSGAWLFQYWKNQQEEWSDVFFQGESEIFTKAFNKL